MEVKMDVMKKALMEVKMDVMKKALMEAGIVNAKGHMTRRARKKLRKWKNRFGDYAIFELWDPHRWPPNWSDMCGMCGLRLGSSKIQIQAKKNVRLFLCWKCYHHAKKHLSVEGIK